jgi:hypothetical protein
MMSIRFQFFGFFFFYPERAQSERGAENNADSPREH